jgi:alkanesulfonate monooxygenase SsuD/methylene tetrahydromethanopterin reductase-like flavin-dependent oxidoreductase (luciferase family)
VHGSTVLRPDEGARQRLTARFGGEVEAWFDDLPDVLVALAKRWQFEFASEEGAGMDIGIGIPNTMLDAPGELFAAWARRAEEGGFSTIASIGRLAYPTHDELTVFAQASGATERIRLLTNILLAPLFPTAIFAKQTATLARLSGGRLTLGLGVGARPDDFEVAGASFHDRGRRFDRQLEALHAVWRGNPYPGTDVRVSPPAPGGSVPILFGGRPELAAPRAVRWNGGFTIGGAPADAAAGAAAAFRSTYAELGGTGSPHVAALFYFSLGEEHTDDSLRNLRTYYANLGEWSEAIAQGAARSEEELRTRIKAYQDAGIDEVLLDPTVAALDQVNRAADVVFR